MKSNKKIFPPALGAIVEQALKENTAWIGKTVLELTCEAIEKHGLSQDNEGCVCLTIDQAKALLRRIPEFKENGDWQLPIERLKERISKAEGK